jgi:hypothetical protein
MVLSFYCKNFSAKCRLLLMPTLDPLSLACITRNTPLGNLLISGAKIPENPPISDTFVTVEQTAGVAVMVSTVPFLELLLAAQGPS